MLEGLKIIYKMTIALGYHQRMIAITFTIANGITWIFLNPYI